MNERLNIIPKKKRSLRTNSSNPSLFNLKSSSSINDVDEEMTEAADILLLFASAGVVLNSVGKLINEDDQGVKIFKKRRVNLTFLLNGDDNENGSSVNHDHNTDLLCNQMNNETRFYGLHYVRKANKKKKDNV